MLKYLKDHILEELDGALDYMEKAVEHKGTSNGCAFRKMSEMELEHANTLTKMFKNAEKDADMSDSDYALANKSVLDKYVDVMGRIEAMKKIYWNNQ